MFLIFDLWTLELAILDLRIGFSVKIPWPLDSNRAVSRKLYMENPI